MSYSEITGVVLIHCNSVNNSYQQNSRVLYTFFPNKSFGQLLDISLKSFKFSKYFDSEIPYLEVWSTDRNSKPLEIGDLVETKDESKGKHDKSNIRFKTSMV